MPVSAAEKERRRKAQEELAAETRATQAAAAPVVKKKKKPPIPVPSMEATWKKPAPKPKPTKVQPVGPGKPKAGSKHLPTQYEYMSEEDLFLRAAKLDTAADRARIRKYNQERERERRDAARAEREARKARRAAVRRLDAKTRDFVGRDKLRTYIETGKGLEPGIDVSSLLAGVGNAGYEAGRAAVRHPLRAGQAAAGGIKDILDWYITEAPEAVEGRYVKGKGYEGGLAEAWDKMSTQEQIDTVMGGKSFANVLQGQGLSPKNIATAIGLAMMAPIPIGRGLPSLASVLLRAGHSAEEVKYMLQSGEGLAEALRAANTPIRPIKRLRAALGAKPVVLRPHSCGRR